MMVSAACCAFEMGLSGAIPLRIGLTTMLGYHAIVGIVEGMLTAGVLSFLFKVRPDLMKINGLGRFGIPDWIGALLFVAIPVYILAAAGTSGLPDPLQKLLAVSPLLPEAEAGWKLTSSARYTDYFLRGAIFLVLIGFGIFAGHLARNRRSRQ